MKNTFLRLAICAAAMLISAMDSRAQLNPLSAQYFSNPYLANPAMAGASGGIRVFGGIRQQWTRLSGTPYSQALTAEFAVGDKTGLGLNLWNDEAGLLKTTRLTGTYAYHVPLNDGSRKLHFGLAFGMVNRRLMNEHFYGDPDDPTISRFNEKGAYLDGDFGVAYTDDRLSLHAAIPNLNGLFRNDRALYADRSAYYISAGYRYRAGGAGIEPQVAFRGIHEHKNIVDAGVRVALINDQLLFTGIYHTSRNATFGMGLNFRALSVLGSYTSETPGLQGYTSGNFELGVGYRF
ncbi:MAG TPA: PorP/SprF family type IX secretion system membrane protein [Sphingobacteriaceae bacterium]